MATPPKTPLFNALPTEVQQAILTAAGIAKGEIHSDFAHAVEARVETVLEKKGGYNDLKDIFVNALSGQKHVPPAWIAAAELIAPGQGSADIANVIKAESPKQYDLSGFLGITSATEQYAHDIITGIIEDEKHVKPIPTPNPKPEHGTEVAGRGGAK